jgi:predicted transcriptional regulator
MTEGVDPLNIVQYIVENKCSQSDAAKHFGITRGRVSQILKAARNKSANVREALNKTKQVEVARKEALVEVQKERAIGDIEKVLKDLDETNQIFKGLVGQGVAAKELGAAIGAAHGLAQTIDKQARIILTLKGLIGNTLVDARSIHINTLADLPPGARASIEREVGLHIMGEQWPLLCDACKKRLQEGR